MTHEEAVNLKRFNHHCTCGGYAHSINGRDPNQPHMSWCPQIDEYIEWKEALRSKDIYTNMNT